jgi:hypothetical protein
MPTFLIRTIYNMEKLKTSKKALRELINNSVLEAIEKLDTLPKPSKKAKKLVGKASKRLAIIFANAIKREEKKKQKIQKSLTYVEDVLKGKKGKKSKNKELVSSNGEA